MQISYKQTKRKANKHWHVVIRFREDADSELQKVD